MICHYCGRRMNHIVGHQYQKTKEHIVPKENGGSNHPKNVIPVCKTCNAMKANNSLEYFLEQVKVYHENNVGGTNTSKKRWQAMLNRITYAIQYRDENKDVLFKKIFKNNHP